MSSSITGIQAGEDDVAANLSYKQKRTVKHLATHWCNWRRGHPWYCFADD
jgi:hypothetical protein